MAFSFLPALESNAVFPELFDEMRFVDMLERPVAALVADEVSYPAVARPKRDEVPVVDASHPSAVKAGGGRPAISARHQGVIRAEITEVNRAVAISDRSELDEIRPIEIRTRIRRVARRRHELGLSEAGRAVLADRLMLSVVKLCLGEGNSRRNGELRPKLSQDAFLRLIDFVFPLPHG
jgi:hypothetical protein